MSFMTRSLAAGLESTYDTEAASISATRIPLASLIFIVALTGTGLVEFFYRPEILGVWLSTYVAEAVILGLPIVFRAKLVERRTFEPVVLVAWVAVVLMMASYAISTGMSPGAIGYAMLCIMTGASLLSWWKTTMQAILVVACCLTVSGLVLFTGARGIETTLMLFATFAGGLISIHGNRYFEIHRRAILVESLRSDAEASINSTLENFAKTLNRELSNEGVEDHIAALARSAMRAQWVLVLVPDNYENQMRVVGGDGIFPTSLDNLKAVSLPVAALPFLRESSRDVDEVTNWGAQVRQFVNKDWKSEVLLAPLRQRGERIGVIVAGHREASEQTPRLLRGIAQHAAIAIAISRLLDQLRRASSMKSEFLATMSHELRTPLHVIMGYTEMLGDMLGGRNDPEVEQILGRLQQNEKSLTDLIEGTLDAHRLEVGRNTIKQMKFDSKALFEQIKLETRWLPRTPGVDLKWELPADSVMMQSDPTKVKVIAKNLIGNALKFTKQGSVRFSAQLDPDSKQLEIVVSDSGPGIPDDEIPHIFEMFRQATPAAADSALSGVGLGLFIVREFSAQLGGTVAVGNNEGGGARFEVVLPLDTDRSSIRLVA
jgi:signal transduction histidine kinase